MGSASQSLKENIFVTFSLLGMHRISFQFLNPKLFISFPEVFFKTLKYSLIAFILAPFNLHADAAYKWVDPQGNIQYSQLPPSDGEATVIEPPPSPSVPKEREDIIKLEKEWEINQEKELAEKQKTEQQKLQVQAKAINCERAKAYLENLSSRRRIKIMDQDGTVKMLSPEELEAEKEKTRQAIKQYCS